VGKGVTIARLNWLGKGMRRKRRARNGRGGRKRARWRGERSRGGYRTGHHNWGDCGQGGIGSDNRRRHDRRRGWRWCGGWCGGYVKARHDRRVEMVVYLRVGILRVDIGHVRRMAYWNRRRGAGSKRIFDAIK
jgi:hypothetical protein